MKKVAFVFPGQGSQYKGMGREIYESFQVAREVFEEVSEGAKVDVAKICFEEDEETLKLTSNAQPAIFAVSMAVLKVLEKEGGIKPFVVAGHSLGEFSAVCCAGCVSVMDGGFLVRKRGEFMESAIPPGKGGMSAVIGLDEETVKKCLEQVKSGYVIIANYNSPEQLVISGEIKPLEEAEEILKSAGAKRVVRLSVSAPFHSKFMKPAGEKLKEVMESINFKDAEVPVVSNVDAQPVTKKEEIKDRLYRQAFMPVRWTDDMKKLKEFEPDIIVEVGPKNVLRGLFRKTFPEMTVISVEKPKEVEKCLSML